MRYYICVLLLPTWTFAIIMTTNDVFIDQVLLLEKALIAYVIPVRCFSSNSPLFQKLVESYEHYTYFLSAERILLLDLCCFAVGSRCFAVGSVLRYVENRVLSAARCKCSRTLLLQRRSLYCFCDLTVFCCVVSVGLQPIRSSVQIPSDGTPHNSAFFDTFDWEF